jgi:Family of unknown function (DUF6288)/HEAT repeats
MKIIPRIPVLLPALCFGMLVLSQPSIAGPPGVMPPIPDFTQGGKTDGSHDWTLGATGARGWMYAWKHTAEARQILVTAVAKGSPADGVLQADDVILGAGGKPFDDDARIQFANALMAAEQETAKGDLKLIRWRAGTTATVEIKLPVMGSYSATAPYDCEKSAKIFKLGCEAIARRGLGRVSIASSINALALLASGKEEYRSLLADYAKQAAELRLESMATWNYSYALMFLAEYVMATGDQSVMPGVSRLALEAARGQSAVGTWGHKFAKPDGNLNGYGAMNSPGIPLTVAMVLAREAGVNDPALDKAITRASAFLRWYVNKGAPPYGDHAPWPGHEDNGKSANAAVLFDLLGDREAAAFFAKMSVAAYDERERGHTGNFFNILWAMPGVSRCGPHASGAYWREHGWYYDLARGWDASFRYQGSPVGEEEHAKYTLWDNTGTYLLAYALPLKKLRLTGKGACSVAPVSPQEATQLIAAGRGYFPNKANAPLLYANRSAKELLEGLSSWSPVVRKRSGEELAKRAGNHLPALLDLLASSDINTRYGATEAFGFLGPKADAAAPQLRAMLKDPDPWLRALAATSLSALGEQARKESLPDLLVMMAAPNPGDPRGMAQRAATVALFSKTGGIIAGSLDGVDRELLYPAIKAVLQNQDGRTRGDLAPIYGKLTDRDIAMLLPEVIETVRKMAPSGEMFSDGIRLAGLDLLSRLGIREGMPLCVQVIDPGRWGLGRRLPQCLEYLTRYGTHAKEVLPQLRAIRAEYGKPDHDTQLLDQAIQAIETNTKAPSLISLEDFVKNHK